MKARWIIIPAALTLVISIGQMLTTEAIVNEYPRETVAAESFQQKTTEALLKNTGCLRCHSADKWVVGPAFQDIAERYKNDDGARDALFKKVKNGGKGNWTELTGGVPMPPHSARLSSNQITELVDWILSRRKENN